MDETSASGWVPPGTKALVVEDSRATRRIFRNLLESLEVEVEDAPDGQAALERLQRGMDDLNVIFCDISMPRMDGFDLCHRLHQADWYDGTPIVMVSTQSDAANVIRALKLGAEDYLPKPFDREVLARILGRVLSHA